MDCHFTEKISLLVDGELDADAAKETTEHLSACPICRSTRDDFLRLRGQLNSYATEPDFIARRRALERILGSEKPPLWRRSIRLPVPAFALLLVVFAALAAWLAFIRQTAPAQTRAASQPEKVLKKPAPAEGAQEALDLARFDRGERAAIFKVRRTSQGDVEQ
jgi:anti-sigma factor RsiW